MEKNLTIGLVGLDSPHAVNFAQLLNDEQTPHHITGAKVVAGFPGGSEDFERSWSRVKGNTQRLREEFAVQIMDSPEAVAECVDLLFITALDGRVHRELFERTVSYKKPTFIDKYLATKTSDAQAILDLSRQHNTAVMSSSAARYATAFVEALADTWDGPVVGIDVFGPLNFEPTQPGLFWLGVHLVQLVVASLGPGCRKVQSTFNEDFDIVVAQWNDGRIATIRGARQGHSRYGVSLHRQEGFRFIDVMPPGRRFMPVVLKGVLQSLSKGRSDVPADEMLEVVRIIEAANQSRATGQLVTLEPISIQ